VRRALVFVSLVLAACGDNLDRDSELAPRSGTRLKLQQYRYQDGTLQADTSAFYDTSLHAMCAPRAWADGELRCVPDVPVTDEARFSDSECTTAFGVADSPVRRPTHFLGFDTVDGNKTPARIYRVNGTTDPVDSYYLLRDDECLGPYPGTFESDTFALGQIETTDVAAFSDSEAGGGRLGLALRETADGLRVPLGTYDRELDLPCTPRMRADGIACEPTNAVSAEDFLDPECRQPAVRVRGERPRVASVIDAAGCPRFYGVGTEGDAIRYRRVNGACVRTPVPLDERVYGLGAPLVLAPLERTVEEEPARRLHHVTLSPVGDPALRFLGEHLVDTATRDECETITVGDVSWCVPAARVQAQTLFATGCTLPVRVVELPERTCRPITFAAGISFDAEEIEVFAIGDPVTMPLYHFAGIGCVEYTPAPGHQLRALGQPLPRDTFLRAVKFGERTP
jgi:hypothetical protein